MALIMKKVDFLTTEKGDDLIVAFAIPTGDSYEVHSLILLRTPKYEFIMDERERGVKVSFDGDDSDFDYEYEMLESLQYEQGKVKIKTSKRDFLLDVSGVEKSEINEMKNVLRKMNFDNKVQLLNI